MKKDKMIENEVERITNALNNYGIDTEVDYNASKSLMIKIDPDKGLDYKEYDGDYDLYETIRGESLLRRSILHMYKDEKVRDKIHPDVYLMSTYVNNANDQHMHTMMTNELIQLNNQFFFSIYNIIANKLYTEFGINVPFKLDRSYPYLQASFISNACMCYSADNIDNILRIIPSERPKNSTKNDDSLIAGLASEYFDMHIENICSSLYNYFTKYILMLVCEDMGYDYGKCDHNYIMNAITTVVSEAIFMMHDSYGDALLNLLRKFSMFYGSDALMGNSLPKYEPEPLEF